ncbi:MAG: glycosyltransferase [Desulfobacterales bacterium]
MKHQLDLVILGLSITSSWGNGHAVTYRALVRELARRGHHVLFLEREVPWYAENRDLLDWPYGRVGLYRSIEDLEDRFASEIEHADVVIIGSYVPQGVDVSRRVLHRARGPVAFYDIDTPVTLAKLRKGDYEYLHPDIIPAFHLYLSFTGGPVPDMIESEYGSPMARPLYCSVDLDTYYPETLEPEYDFGYMGTYSPDRQPVLDRLFLEPARSWPQGRFTIAGPQYPDTINWPGNIRRLDHLNPADHRRFYRSLRYTLNVTRADMVQTGYSPSVRLFEAGACSVPVISDYWEGLDTFFKIGEEILVSRSADETVDLLRSTAEEERIRIGHRAFLRVLRDHSTERRVSELESYIDTVAG